MMGNERQRSRILVAISQDDRPYHALIRGYQLARACDADLAVVHVLADRLPLSSILFPQRYTDELADAVHRDIEAMASAAAWCDRELPEPLGDGYIVRRGDLVRALAAEISSAPTRFLVVSASTVDPRHAVELANNLDVPVLLARAQTANPVVIAATDLRDPSLPVLHEAAELAPALAARLVCVHNRPPQLPGIDPMTAMFLPMPPVEAPDRDARALREATAKIADDAEAVVTGQVRAVDAILDVARAQDADLIVVGAVRHASIYRWLTGSTAAAVVRRARRSVLLTPLARHRGPAAATT